MRFMVLVKATKDSEAGAPPTRELVDGAKRAVVDGPFAETKELVAGYWLWECKSLDEAIAWVKRCPNPMPGPSEIEIRPVVDLADFGDAVSPEADAAWKRLKKEVGDNG